MTQIKHYEVESDRHGYFMRFDSAGQAYEAQRNLNAHDDLVKALENITNAYRKATNLFDSNAQDVFTVAAHNAIAKAGAA